MTLNGPAFAKACSLYHALDGKSTAVLTAAIETYLREAFKPGQFVCGAEPAPLPSGELIVGEPIQPQRDYRKELWVGVYLNGGQIPETSAQRAVQAFDKFFAEGGAQ